MSRILFVLILAMLVCGCSRQDEVMFEKQSQETVTLSGNDAKIQEPIGSPYWVIIDDVDEVRIFLNYDGCNYDEIWIPDKEDVAGLKESLRKTLLQGIKVEKTVGFKKDYILSNLPEYSMEISGFIKDGQKYIISNMILRGYGKRNRFAIIMDGGCGIVKVVFRAENLKVVSIECNGEG